MRHQKDRPVKAFQGSLDRFLGSDIEMVRRLIQEQAVGAVQHKLQQDQPRFLPSRKRADGLEHVFPVEHHAAQQAPRLFIGQPVFCQEVLHDGLSRIEPFVALGKIADPDTVADFAFPAKRRDLRQDGLQQRRFPAAVGTDDGTFFPAAQDQVHIFEKDPSRVACIEMFHDDDLVRRLRRMGQPQFEGLLPDGRVDALEPVQLGLPAPGHLAFDARLETADIGFGPADIILLGLIGPFLGKDLEILLFQIAGIISLEPVQSPAFHLEDAVHDGIEESPVMGNHEDAAAELPEIFFEPFRHNDIQMVRRFIEDQQVR